MVWFHFPSLLEQCISAKVSQTKFSAFISNVATFSFPYKFFPLIFQFIFPLFWRTDLPPIQKNMLDQITKNKLPCFGEESPVWFVLSHLLSGDTDIKFEAAGVVFTFVCWTQQYCQRTKCLGTPHNITIFSLSLLFNLNVFHTVTFDKYFLCSNRKYSCYLFI